MPGATDTITDGLATLVQTSGFRGYEDLQNRFKLALDNLAERGIVQLGPDHQVGGHALEVRVRLLLAEMGLTVSIGRGSLEDLVVSVPDFAQPSIPLVVEVKSGKQDGPDTADLRQLDDWVFQLSGEAAIRRLGIENQGRARNWRDLGALQSGPVHPSPHKGVLLYNGPVGRPFSERASTILQPNQKEFALSRSFCVLSMPCLLSWASGCAASPPLLRTFWLEVQSCMGELRHHVPAAA